MRAFIKEVLWQLFLFFVCIGVTILWAMWTTQNMIKKGERVTINGRDYFMGDLLGETKSSPKFNKKNQGGNISCNVLKELTNPNIQKGVSFSNEKGSTNVDCYDNVNNIAIKYIPKERLVYESDDDSEVYQFYKEVKLDHTRRDVLDDEGVTLLEIPYNVDMCDQKGVCKEKEKKKVRKERIKNYLEKKIDNIFKVQGFV